MSNKTGVILNDGKLFLNGEKISGSGSANNRFDKIVCFGTSIENTPSEYRSWPKRLADALGLTFYYNTNNVTKGVVSYALGGGKICWNGQNYPMYTGTNTRYEVYHGSILAGFSISQAERAEAIEYYSNVDRWTIGGVYVGLTAEEIASASSSHYENLCYDNSLLNNLDADLFIFGTYGINDRPSTRLSFTDSDGNTCKTSTIRCDGTMRLDRRTIFGAYNYVLKMLYNAKPTANVVILGQHTRRWDEQDIVNGVQMSVADLWQIPFADWGNHLPLNDTYKGATPEGSNSLTRTEWQTDAVHLAENGARLLGNWVADYITKTELAPLNPMFSLT